MDFTRLIRNIIEKQIKSQVDFEGAIGKMVDNIEKYGCPNLEKLIDTINRKNKYQKALNSANSAIRTIKTTNNTVQGTINGLQTGITVIKAIATPTVIAAVPIPINVIIVASDGLEILKEILKQGKALSGSIIDTLDILSSSLQKMSSVLDLLNGLLLLCVSNYQDQLTPEEFQDLVNKINENVILEDSGQGEDDGQETEDELQSLLLDKENPLLYKGFALTLQNDPEPSIPQLISRRIQALGVVEGLQDIYRQDQLFRISLEGIKLYYPEQSDLSPEEIRELQSEQFYYDPSYSYGTSLNTLLESTKNTIDSYLLNSPTARKSFIYNVSIIDNDVAGIGGGNGGITDLTPGKIIVNGKKYQDNTTFKIFNDIYPINFEIPESYLTQLEQNNPGYNIIPILKSNPTGLIRSSQIVGGPNTIGSSSPGANTTLRELNTITDGTLILEYTKVKI